MEQRAKAANSAPLPVGRDGEGLAGGLVSRRMRGDWCRVERCHTIGRLSTRSNKLSACSHPPPLRPYARSARRIMDSLSALRTRQDCASDARRAVALVCLLVCVRACSGVCPQPHTSRPHGSLCAEKPEREGSCRCGTVAWCGPRALERQRTRSIKNHDARERARVRSTRPSEGGVARAGRRLCAG